MNRKTVTLSVIYLTLSSILAGYLFMFGGWIKSKPINSRQISASSNLVKGVSLENIFEEPIGGGSEVNQFSNLKKYPKYLSANQPYIQASQYVAYNPESGKVLYHSVNQDPVSIASTTKIMSAFLTIKYGNLEDIVEVSAEASEKIGSSMGIYKGEKILVRDLLYGSLLVSGNDSTYALAEYIGSKLIKNEFEQKVTVFVEEMNRIAKVLNLENTKFQDPCGLNDEGKSTAYDMSKLMSVVMRNKTIQTIMQTAQITVTDISGKYKHDLKNSNRFITDYQYPGTVAGKTGFTPEAGHCLITAVKKEGQTYIVTILNTHANTNEASAVEARKLMDFTLSNISFE